MSELGLHCTGGLLKDDWVTIDDFKLALLAYVNPNPSILRMGPGGSITIDNSQPHPPPTGFPASMQGADGFAAAAMQEPRHQVQLLLHVLWTED